MAAIRVGWVFKVEVSEVKCRVTYVLCDIRAAMQKGIVRGGGVVLLYVSTTLEGLKLVNFD